MLIIVQQIGNNDNYILTNREQW